MKRNFIYSPWVLLVVFLAAVAVMAAYESLKELIFQGGLTLWQSHGITILVTSVIATLSASIIRSWMLSVYAREKEIEIQRQSLVSYKLVISAVNHIVYNVLNYLQLVQLEIETDGRVTDETMKLLQDSIVEANQQMRILNEIQAPADPQSYQDIFPK